MFSSNVNNENLLSHNNLKSLLDLKDTTVQMSIEEVTDNEEKEKEDLTMEEELNKIILQEEIKSLEEREKEINDDKYENIDQKLENEQERELVHTLKKELMKDLRRIKPSKNKERKSMKPKLGFCVSYFSFQKVIFNLKKKKFFWKISEQGILFIY
jgi:hypothetical protein